MRGWSWLAGGGSSVGFGIVQTPLGTSPAATTSNDTLTLSSSNSTLDITGNSGTKTVDIVIPSTLALTVFSLTTDLTTGFVKTPTIFDPSSNVSVDVNNHQLYDFSSNLSLDYGQRKLHDSFGTAVVNWDLQAAYDAGTAISISWGSRQLYDNIAVTSVDWTNRYLYNAASQLTADWQNGVLYTPTSIPSVDWSNRYLYNAASQFTVDWQGCILYTPSSTSSIDWSNRQLIDSNAIQAFYYETGSLRGLYDSSGNSVFTFDDGLVKNQNLLAIDLANRIFYDASGAAVSADFNSRLLYDSFQIDSINYTTRTLFDSAVNPVIEYSTGLGFFGAAPVTQQTGIDVKVAINNLGLSDNTLYYDPANFLGAVPVSKGGTGLSSISAGAVMIGNGLSAVVANSNLSFLSNQLIASKSGSSNSAPTFTFLSDTNTGMYSSANDQLDFTTNGVLRFSIGSSGNASLGNVVQSTTRFSITIGTNTHTGMWIRGAGSQSGQLFQLQNSAGSVLSAFDANGYLSVGAAALNSVSPKTYASSVDYSTSTITENSATFKAVTSVNNSSPMSIYSWTSIWARVDKAGASTAEALYGIGGQFNQTAGTTSNAKALYFVIQNNGGTITDARGVDIYSDVVAGATTSTYTSLYIRNALGAGTINTQYGLYIEDISKGTTTYAIRGFGGQVVLNDSATDSDFRYEGTTDANCLVVDASANSVGIGTATPGSKLDVAGSFQCDSITNDTGLAAGTYTPTLTNVTNISASTAYVCQYMRVGSVVTVSGRVDIDATSPGAIELGMSLPVASNFSAVEQCAGVGSTTVANEDALNISADTTNDRAAFKCAKNDTTNHAHYFTFTYRVI